MSNCLIDNNLRGRARTRNLAVWLEQPTAEVTASIQGWLYACRAQAVQLKRKQEAHAL